MKVHYRENTDGLLSRSACGLYGVRTTDKPEDVTCQDCRERMEREERQ